MGDICSVMVTIPMQTGVPTDVVTNTFHFESLDGESITSARCALLFSSLASFYGNIFNSTTLAAMSSYMAPALTVMKAYNLSDPKPRTPVRESTVPLTVTSVIGTILPTEAAAVLSYRTDYESGINKGSQRGRIYLGGLHDACITSGTGTRGSVLKPEFITRMTTAASVLYSSTLSNEWGWSVWSPRLQQAFAVAGGWVDNAIDTQRRRGQAATTRLTFTT